jgi:hypothetical protein
VERTAKEHWAATGIYAYILGLVGKAEAVKVPRAHRVMLCEDGDHHPV